MSRLPRLTIEVILFNCFCRQIIGKKWKPECMSKSWGDGKTFRSGRYGFRAPLNHLLRLISWSIFYCKLTNLLGFHISAPQSDLVNSAFTNLFHCECCPHTMASPKQETIIGYLKANVYIHKPVTNMAGKGMQFGGTYT